jgi:cagE trbE virB component of type IV transporter system
LIFERKEVKMKKEKKGNETASGKFVKSMVDKFRITTTNDSVNFYIPYRRMIDKNTLLLKNGGFARIFEIVNQDLDYADDIDKILEYLNDTLKEAGSGVVLHYETQKVPITREEEKIGEFSPIPTVIGHKMRSSLFTKRRFYEIRHYLTISYLYDYNKEKSLDEALFNDGTLGKQDYMKQFNDLIKEFNRKVEDILFRLDYAVLRIQILENGELLNFLYRTINPLTSRVNLRVPPLGFSIDEWLSCSQMEIKNGMLKVGDYYTKVVSIKLFPDAVVPQIFSELEKLKFPFRSVTRLIGLSKEEAVTSIKNIEKYQFGKRYNMVQIILNAFNAARSNNPDSGNVNRIRKSYEAKYAREELEANRVSYGYYTFSVIISDKNPQKLEEKTDLVVRIINRHGFTCLDDKLNVKDAYFGAMPANIKQNIRKSPMNSESLGYMLPISSVFEGLKWDERINAPNLFDTISNDRIFHFNNKVDKDVGHTLIIGPTGKGKSVMLGTIVLNFMKYESVYLDDRKNFQKSGSQVFIFDKGASSKVLTMASGGKFYDLDSENHMAFQPLRNIDKTRDLEFAMDWVMGLIEQEDEHLARDVENRKEVYDGLLSLSKMEEPKKRTITNLVKLIQAPKLKEALRVYSQEGIYGSYFDNNDDVMEDANFMTFEMGKIMEKPKVLLPVLEYLFHRIETEKLGKDIPTLVVLDECWVFLRHERMKAKIEEWLKVLRKANASVVFATQSLSDIEKSSIATTIKDACMTKIFLPNENALSTHSKIYEGYNLSQVAIATIDRAYGQRQYLYNSKYGTRLFELNLSKLELAYVGAGDDISKAMIEKLSNTYMEQYPEPERKNEYLRSLNKAYLKYKYDEGKIDRSDLEFADSIIEKIS